MTGRAMRAARALVVATARWPLLSSGYAAAYRSTVVRLGRAVRDVGKLDAVLLRGSATGRVRAGLSDIDAVVVMRSGLSARDELDTVARLRDALRRVNVPFPLVRDVHVVTRDELEAWGKLCVYLLGALHVDASPLMGNIELPECARGELLVGESLIRGTAWWTDRGLRQLLLEPGWVGRRLASRSFAKARRFADAHAGRPTDILPTMETYNDPSHDEPARWQDAIDALRRLDDVLPPAPQLPAEERSDHPTITTATPRFRRWVEAIEDLPAFRGALLSTEGASRADLRLYLVLDPSHASAADDLKHLADHLRRAPMPHRELCARCPFPIVVSPRQAERNVFLRWTALEPVARARHGKTLFGEIPEARASCGEILRSLAYEAAHLLVGARELTNASRIDDLVCNVVPSYDAALRGEWLTSPPARGEGEAGYERLHRSVSERRGSLVDAAIRER